ncbi:MAG: phospholipase D-like domain-containing protein [Pseudomonadales bacterium]|nr:phospholipase D-like domain-containing protein [Pseudomonadales bacterium]
MPIRQGKITIHLGPQEQGGPDDLMQPIVDFIDSARRRQSLMIAVQEIDHEPIARAIIRARERGVTIDVVIEQSYLLNDRIPADPMKAGGRHEINRMLFSALLRSKIDVKSDYNTDIFHQKFMVLGNRVLTGSTNFTTTGVTKNLNHVVEVNDAAVANAYKREFREIKRGNFGKYSVDREEKPKEVSVSGVRVKPLFAPDHAPEMEIMKQILKARERVDFAVFTFSESSGIDDALLAAKDRGVQVRGVLDSRQANQRWAASHGLKAAGGIDLFVAGNRGGLGKVHHKLMTIDDKLTIWGSFNYTGPANKTNDENILIIGDLEETRASARTAQQRIALQAREEIDRIVTDFGRHF